jgi:hypothetical protein
MNRNPFSLILLVFCTATTLTAQTQPPADTLSRNITEEKRDSADQSANQAPNLGHEGAADSLANIGPSSEMAIYARLLRMERMEVNIKQEGTVKLKLCIDQTGKVISADFVPLGSTTEDKQLIEAATENALKWQFSKSETERQCGTIAFNFRAK